MADAGMADAGKADAGKADAGMADAGMADAGMADQGRQMQGWQMQGWQMQGDLSHMNIRDAHTHTLLSVMSCICQSSQCFLDIVIGYQQDVMQTHHAWAMHRSMRLETATCLHA